MPTTRSCSEAGYSDVKKKYTFLGNVFGKIHPSSSSKKTPCKTTVVEQSHRGTVRKLFPFSGGSKAAQQQHSNANHTSTPYSESHSRSKKSRLVGLVSSPTRLFRTSEELIPASRGGGMSHAGDNSSSIKVVVRVRPKNEREQKIGVTVCAEESDNGGPDTLVLQSSGTGEKHTFSFDTIMNQEKGQKDVYDVSGSSIIKNCLQGFNGCLLAYGQTGSGKTYSMMGDCHSSMGDSEGLNRGIIQRSFEDLFHKVKEKELQYRDAGGKMEYSVTCSFIEIYNESISDLTNMASGSLAIRDDPMSGIFVEGVSWHPANSMRDVEAVLSLGMSNRRVAETLANDRSSRSHSVFTATIEQRMINAGETMPTILRSQLHLVDLAGSERQKSSGAAGERLKEASNINKSLSALGHVIMSLVDVQQGKQRHVPYRDSKLTFLLQDALGGTAKTVLLATVSPACSNAFETLSTLRFADSVKRIKNKSIVHQDASGDAESLRKEVIRLRQELLKVSQRDQEEVSLEENQTEGNVQKALMAALAREEVACSRVASFQEEVIALQRLVDAKEADLQRTKMMLRLKESRITRSQGSKGDNEQVRALESEISILKQTIDSHPEVKRFALENIRLQRKVEEYARQLSSHMDGAKMVPVEELQQLRTQLLVVTAKAEKAEEEARVLKAEAVAAKESLRTAEKKREMYENTIPRMHDDNETSRVLALESELDNLRVFSNQQAAKITEYDELCAHAGNLDSVVEQLSQKYAAIKIEKDEWYDAYSVLLTSVVHGWSVESELKERLRLLETTVEEQNKKYTYSYEKAKDKISEAAKSASLLREELEEKHATIQQLEQVLGKVSQEREAMSIEISQHKNDIEILRKEYDEQSITVSSLKHLVESQKQDIDAHLSTIDDLRNQLSNLDRKLSDKSSEYFHIERQLHSLQAALASAQIDAQMAQSQLKEKTKQLTFSEESESELRATIIDLQEEMTRLTNDSDAKIQKVQHELAVSKELILDVESELKAYKNRCALLTEQAKTPHDHPMNDQGFKKERLALQTRIKDLEERLKDAEKRTKANGTQDGESNTGPLGKEAHARNISQKLRDAEDTVTFLRQEVLSLKASIKSRDETLAKLRNQMAMEVNDAAQQVQELLATQARADALEEELSKLKRLD